MRLQVYSVFDKAARAYLRPFYSRAKGEAIRSFMEACHDEKHEFNRHAADFVLFFHGEFDDNSGVFVDLVEPQRVVSALECMPDEGRAAVTRDGEASEVAQRTRSDAVLRQLRKD